MSDPIVLGIEIGGTKLQLGLGHGDGRLLALTRLAIAPEAGAPGILAQIEGAFGPLLDKIGASREDVEAAGIGFGGPVDVGRGVVTVSHQVAGWEGYPLADWVRDRLGIRLVTIENDADTAALGEARFGAGVGFSPLLYVTIGSGIGGGLIIDDSIYRGAGAGAVEIGHLMLAALDDDEEPMTLEQMASGWSIGARGRAWAEHGVRDGWESGGLVRIAEGDLTRITAESVAEVARSNPCGPAAGIIREATKAMAEGLAHAVTLLAPRRIILGGGVSRMGEEFWFGPIRRELDERVFAPFRGTFDVVPAALGEEVVVHGALALARDARAGQ